MSLARLAAPPFVAVLVAAACSSGGNGTSASVSSSASSSSSAGGGSGGSSSTTSSSSASPASSTTSSSSASSSGSPDGGPPPACAVASTGTSGVVLQGTVLTATAPLSGEVFIDGTGKIACVAASCSTTAGFASATVLSCPDAVISPGLINAHDHTEYATTGPLPHGTTRWAHRNEWRTGADGMPTLQGTPSSTTSPAIIAAQELRFVLGGATSVVGSGGVHGLLRNLAAYPDETMVEGLTGPTVFFDTFPLGDSNGTELTSGCAYPKPRSPSTAFAGGAAYAPHVSEGINLAAENEFTCVSGSLGLLTTQTAVIHGVGLNAKDVSAIASAQAKLVWSPRSNVDLYGDTAPVTVMKALGVTMALGTDWLASGSMNMLRELQCADFLDQSYFGSPFTAQDLWTMATKNAAIAARYDTQIGELATGLFGDVVVLSGATKDYGAVIQAGVEDVRLVLRAGKVLYGDAETVSALSPSCEAIDVCGYARQVCVDTPGLTLADITAAAAPIYPLFFCKGTTPTNEPSCVPYHDTYPAGETGTSYTMGQTTGDADGDGIPDAMDDCPAVFNPVRPMDGAAQADVNGNGTGDACDPTPAM